MPPRRREKEKKARQHAMVSVFKGFINLVTETMDVVDAAFYAIHASARADGKALGFMGPLDKMEFLYANAHLINWREFSKNMIKNGAEDWFYGNLGRGSKWFNQETGNSGFTGGAVGGGVTGKRGGRPENPVTDDFDRNPLLDAFNDFVDDQVGTDLEWRMANDTWRTAKRTYGLPQDGSVAGNKVKPWKAHSPSAKRRKANRR